MIAIFAQQCFVQKLQRHFLALDATNCIYLTPKIWIPKESAESWHVFTISNLLFRLEVIYA